MVFEQERQEVLFERKRKVEQLQDLLGPFEVDYNAAKGELLLEVHPDHWVDASPWLDGEDAEGILRFARKSAEEER